MENITHRFFNVHVSPLKAEAYANVEQVFNQGTNMDG